MRFDDAMERTATLSACRTYRYDLTRRWGPGETALWVMLNPSTADSIEDDPTIRRVVGFSRAWGYDAAVVVNLFAYRATDPLQMLAASAPIGPENDEYIRHHAATAHRLVAAWGTAAKGVRDRAAIVRDLLCPFGTVHCLGRTAQGGPRHPLYVPASQPLERWA